MPEVIGGVVRFKQTFGRMIAQNTQGKTMFGEVVREAGLDVVRPFFRWANDNCMRATIRMLSSTRFRPINKCFIVETNGKIVAAATFFFTESSQWELATVYGLKQYRRNGLGSRLARFGMQSMIDIGISPIHSLAATRGGSRLLKCLKRNLASIWSSLMKARVFMSRCRRGTTRLNRPHPHHTRNNNV